MLNGITTRTSTPHEDAEPWPGGSARPVLDYLTGTLGMTGAAARELLKAARTAQAETGPGALADYPVPGGDAHLLIHYAPSSRAYRFKLTAPGENEVPPGTNPEPGTAPGNRPGPDGPPGVCRRSRCPWQPVAASLTVSMAPIRRVRETRGGGRRHRGHEEMAAALPAISWR